MPPDEKELLEKNLELAEDNNRMLHSMRRSQRISSAISFIYWIFIIGSAVGAYYFVQPYVDQITSLYQGAKSNLDSLNGTLKGIKNIQK